MQGFGTWGDTGRFLVITKLVTWLINLVKKNDEGSIYPVALFNPYLLYLINCIFISLKNKWS